MLYFVTTFEKLEKHRLGWWDFGSRRTVGYFFSLDEARHIVRNNVCDICETVYDYAIIEGIEEGLYGELKVQELYRVQHPTVEKDGRIFYNIHLTYERMPLPKTFTRSSVVIG